MPKVATILAFASLAAGAAALQGCMRQTPAAAVNLADRPIMPADLEASQGDSGRLVLFVRMQIATIEVPVGMVSASEEIWSYLDEEPVRPVRSPAFSLNGMRISRGSERAWPYVAQEMRRLTGKKVQESTSIFLPGDPVPILLKADQPDQTIFLFSEDRTLTGRRFPPGDNLLTVCCTLNQDDPSQVLITAVPQIRSTQSSPKFVMQDGRYVMVNQQDVYTLEALTFRAAVPSKDFLVIGPDQASQRVNSFGHSFFLKEKNGLEFETLLVLKPEVMASRTNVAGTQP